MHVAVAIVGFRNPDDIVRCLEALARSTHADLEVVVCENGGPTAFEALYASLPKNLPGGQPVRALAAERNLGFAGGVNRCLAASPDPDAWWVLNPDTEAAADALELQLARLAKGDCDAVGCTLHLPDGTVQSHGGHWQAWLARAISIGHGERQGT
ncbi:MAG: glycosyltransferase family 2 protein, partial [Caulobacteraceae bacterium]